MHLEATNNAMACPKMASFQQTDMEDLFEQLHDCLLMQVFNMVDDIKALGRCCVVCKRFQSLIPLVENVTVKVDCVISGEESSLNATGRGAFGHLIGFVVGSIVKPFQMLQHMLGTKKAKASHHSPCEVLKNFMAIRNLRIELPGGELGAGDGVLVMWKAEFGSTLDSCVLLGASAVVKPEKMVSQVGDDAEGNTLPESFCTSGGLKRRVVWTVSSLIAASVRHYLLQQIISEHPTLVRLVLTDAEGQGFLCMGKEQLEDFRTKPLAASASAKRTQVPALNMKLWYAPYLELPGGTGLKGATLVAIRPIDQLMRKDVDGLIAGAFEEPFTTAASLLVKSRYYLLEMNSF